VDLTTPTASPTLLPPSVKNWKVMPITPPGQSPATYRVNAEVQNADELIWLCGDRVEHISAPQPGLIDKYITLEKPGVQPISLMVLSKTRKDPQVMVYNAEVKSRKEDVYQAMMTITDTQSRTEDKVLRESPTMPLRDKAGKETRGFSRTIAVSSPSAIIMSIEVDPAQTKKAIRRDRVKVEIAKDGKSATISGDWQLSGNALMVDAGGSDMPVQLIVKERHQMPTTATESKISAQIDTTTWTANMQLPPAAAAGVKREISIDVGILKTDDKRTTLAAGKFDAAGSWVGPFSASGRQLQFRATTVKDVVTIKMESTPAPVRK
jgi:hypothetical protein